MSVIETPSDGPTIEDTSDDDTDESTLTEDQIFHLLQNERRRNVLRYLQGEDGTVRMRDIAEQVAAWEHDTTVKALTSKQRQRVYIPLYQSHLPKLDEEGIIEYNQSRGIVERASLADRLDRHLGPVDDDDATDDESRSWNSYYLGASGVSASFFAGMVFNVPPLTALPAVALSAVVLLLFTALTVTKIATE
ncbi:hypothetical protein [Halostella sp. PRR32]|uniref:DUF7344 domain-containing protein n=1 Tax=Halostella sp. PRR32 TaxID=3098147 RepID=UPI00110F4067|nr:hypothetical protein [Halostella sp. PRR32]